VSSQPLASRSERRLVGHSPRRREGNRGRRPM
jgi:hypothetical protein